MHLQARFSFPECARVNNGIGLRYHFLGGPHRELDGLLIGLRTRELSKPIRSTSEYGYER
jgi:hypothetical protein